MATSCGFESHRPHQNCSAIAFGQCLLSGEERTPCGDRETDAMDPTETCRESYCLLSSTSFQGCSWGEIDLAQDSRDEPGVPISNGSVSRRSIPVCGVLLASARRCVSR